MWKKTSQMYKNRESVDVEKACVGAVRTAQLICSGAKKNKKTINCDTKFASAISALLQVSSHRDIHVTRNNQNGTSNERTSVSTQ